MWLEPMNCEIVTWAQSRVWCLNDWAIQASHRNLILEHFVPSQRNLNPINSHSPFPQIPQSYHLFTISMDLHVLDISEFLWPNNITLHGNMPHFVYPFINWWTFRCFYFWAIMNNPSISTCVKVFLWIYIFIFLGYIPRNRIAGSHGNSIFICLRTFKMFSKMAAPFYNFFF